MSIEVQFKDMWLMGGVESFLCDLCPTKWISIETVNFYFSGPHGCVMFQYGTTSAVVPIFLFFFATCRIKRYEPNDQNQTKG